MEILNIIRIVIEIIMFILICTASIYVVIYLKRVNSGLTNISTKVDYIGNSMKPVLNDISILTGKLSTISDSIVEVSNNAENISGKILDKTEEAELYIDTIKDAAVTRIRNIINMIHALNAGFRTFYKKIY